MAKKDNNANYNISQINKFAGNMKDTLDKLYSDTYFNTDQNNKDLDFIRKSIDASISKIMAGNCNDIGMTSITHLYTRLANDNKVEFKDLEELLGDDTISDIVSSIDQSNIRNYDQEIDSILKYMPRLQDGLNLRKENVLSADTYGNDFFNAKNLSKTSDEEQAKFADNLNYLKKKYKLVEFFDTSYDNASKYGEDFIFVSPYSREFAKLLKSKHNNSQSTNPFNIKISESSGLTVIDGLDKTNAPLEMNKFIKESSMPNTNIEFVFESELLTSAFNEVAIINEAKNKFQKTIDDDIEFDGFNDYDGTSTDGFIDKDKPEDIKINMNGCVLKRLQRDKVIPIYIEQTCLGYYYFEGLDSEISDLNKNSKDPFYAFRTGSYNSVDNTDVSGTDEIIHFLTSQIANAIDKRFIETNSDIRREIYMIMKNNDLFNSESKNKIKVTFIPPEYVHHIYFKLDPKTHRGISDLENALLPAKLYASIYLSNCIGVLTRGQDKRVYYIKQTVDTNIAGNLLNTINQIKKSNFGLRDVNSIGQILNITGRYNDYYIPTNQGDPPIQFEIMPGQNIEIKTDLLNILEEMAVNSIDTPLELLQARESVDYALHYSMTSSKFFNKVIKRQSITNPFFSRLLMAIYNYEFSTNDIIEFKLPTPIHLKMSNISTIIETSKTFAESISDYEYPGNDDDQKKAMLKRKIMRQQLASHVDQSLIDQFKDEIDREFSSQNSDQEQ